jgi:hypothetical protein
MKASTKFAILLLLIAVLSVVNMPGVYAQGCAMCAAVGEASQSAGSTAADGLNKGILYILLTPYLILSTIGFFWWRSRRKVAEQ